MTLADDLKDHGRLRMLAAGFRTSSYGELTGCIGAIDGLSSGDDDAGVDLTSGENHSVTGWYTSEHTDAGLTDWDPQYLAQRGQGTRTDTLCNPRQFHTKRMAAQMMVRPNFREW